MLPSENTVNFIGEKKGSQVGIGLYGDLITHDGTKTDPASYVMS